MKALCWKRSQAASGQEPRSAGPTMSKLRLLLEQSRLIIAVQSVTEDEVLERAPTQFWHVAYVNLKTWQLSLMRVEIESWCNGYGFLELRPCYPMRENVLTSVQCAAHVWNLGNKLCMSFYNVVDNAGLLPRQDMRPEIVEVEKATAGAATAFWQGQEAERKAQKDASGKKSARKRSSEVQQAGGDFKSARTGASWQMSLEKATTLW